MRKPNSEFRNVFDMRALITGVTGQDGAYLSQLLLGKGYEVYGTYRPESVTGTRRLRALGVEPEVRLVPLDLTAAPAVQQLVRELAPDEVYNLAGQSSVMASFEQPLSTAAANAMGALHLLEALRQERPRGRLFQASSSELFGLRAAPQNEATPFQARSPYAVAKLFAHQMTRTYRESYGLYACAGILFSHESPLRGTEFVTRKISKGVARIKCGLADTLFLGDLEARRDWGFAGDYVRAMWLMLQQERPDDYVIATGEAYSVGQFAELAFAHAGLDWRTCVHQDASLLRPTEAHELVGNPAKARTRLEWQPEVKLPDLVRMMVDHDLEEILNSQQARGGS